MASRFHVSRENRLLLLVVAVSAGALLLLGRFRFPGESRPVNPAPAPLERLAARATYDDLASIIAQLQTRVAPALLVLRVIGPAVPQPRAIARLLEPPGDPPSRPRLVLAARVGSSAAVAQLAPGDRVEGIVGADGDAGIVAVDPVRLIGLVNVPPADASMAMWRDAVPAVSPRYAAVAEATQGGPALRPLFLGRTDPFSDPRWQRPLLALGGASVTQPGSLIFSLDGTLEGLAVLQENLPMMAPRSALLAAVGELQQGRVPPAGDLGIEAADLTPTLAAATGADSGAIVTYVRSPGPAAGRLQTGDVITGLNETPIFSAEALSLEIARTPPGTTITLAVLRQKAPVTVEIIAGEPGASAAAGSAELGLILRDAPGVGAEVVRVLPDSPASLAGLAAGDFVTRLDGADDPAARRIERAFASAKSGSYLMLALRRRGAHVIVAVRKP